MTNEEPQQEKKKRKYVRKNTVKDTTQSDEQSKTGVKQKGKINNVNIKRQTKVNKGKIKKAQINVSEESNSDSEQENKINKKKHEEKTNDDAKNRTKEANELGKAAELERAKLTAFPECIVGRAGWAAAPPVGEGQPLEHPIPNVVFTYKTGVDKCEDSEKCVTAMKELQRRHMEGGMSDIAFNFLIGGDNRVYEGRGWHTQPDPNFQFPELQGKRLDIGFIGDYETSKDELSWIMAGLAIELAHYGVTQNFLPKRYDLIESEMYLVFDEYEPNKKPRKDLKMYIEDYYDLDEDDSTQKEDDAHYDD